ncbi:MAG TPA: threonine synthase [Candidatus Cloacimonadota bacterium]|nr:threonine synthase [Candidatus Cloacimonadota bacterium]
MNHFRHWRCTTCGAEYARDEVRYLCPDCSCDYRPGIPLPGVLEALFDYESIAAEWRKEPDIMLFSALDTHWYPPLPVGKTPLFEVERLGRELGIKRLWIKNDALNPSGSFKDRASQLMVAEARRLGIDEIVCASTGNAASSLASLCASCGIKAVIFTPAAAPVAKLTQIKVHGAELHRVDGTYDDAFAQALDYSATHECLNRNTAYHPLTIEGKKSSGLEIFLQLGRVPDWIVIPVGDGVILAGIHKAFVDLHRAGLIDRLPRLLAVQAASSDAITSYWETGVYHDADQPATLADSISVRTPCNAHWAVKAIKDTYGKAIRVSDLDILNAQKELAQKTGVFAEPSCSATLAGLKAALGKAWIKASEEALLLITGHGLKDIDALK